ncbi:efflux RND transporter periplasmic adaptor subunit [Balneatrix alpica]|uniref:efflux RND transporter periplasmic adaptor subunit n=1 Tax=Balneatrix alpica TaxID=75684 RepID=UPI0027391648|nr:efflux RND transporter periplasmic adaptor subunit [Balneatrix alpica]
MTARSLSFVLLCSWLLTACSEPPAPIQTTSVRPVKLVQVSDAKDQLVREFPARIAATQEADLSFRVGGELRQLPVLQGQRVQKGELIAELDPTDYQLQLKDREASYQLALTQFQRIEKLLGQRLVSQAEYDQKKAQLSSAEAALRLARQELAYTQLKAPFAGVVAATYVENFQVVQAKQAVVTLQAGNVLDAIFQVPENLLGNIQGDGRDYHPQVRLDSLGGLMVEGTLKEYSTVADAKTLTYEVRVSFEKPANFTALPGMRATVIVDFAQLYGDNQQATLEVPVEAVFSPDQQGEQDKQVWVASQDPQGKWQVQARAVEVGQISSKGIQILSGLTAGEQVVATGVHELHEGMEVKPWVRERGL